MREFQYENKYKTKRKIRDERIELNRPMMVTITSRPNQPNVNKDDTILYVDVERYMRISVRSFPAGNIRH